MNEIWHIEGKPNFGTLVVIINSERKIIFFGYYYYMNIKPGDKWAYMEDLVNNTIEEKQGHVKLNEGAGMFNVYNVKQMNDNITKKEYIIIDGDIYSVMEGTAKYVEAAYNSAKEADEEDVERVIDAVKKYGELIGSVSLIIKT